MGYIGFKTSPFRYFYPIFSIQSSVFSQMFSLMRLGKSYKLATNKY